MHLIILLVLIASFPTTGNSVQKEVEFNACDYAKSYREANYLLFEDKEEILKQCAAIRINDQRLRGANRDLMNDVKNILKFRK